MPTIASAALLIAMIDTGDPQVLNSKLREYVAARVGEFDSIPPNRKQDLMRIALYVRERVLLGEPARLTFICTHNSRRSHLAQIWAQAAATYYGMEAVETFSGGTEATAFNLRAVNALRRAGFEIPNPAPGDNPHYQVSFCADAQPMDGFSKRYFDEPNPKSEFCAVMTCSQADQNCPTVMGAVSRFALPYDDPKQFDGTAEESARYDERCRQIAHEMLFMFSQVKP